MRKWTFHQYCSRLYSIKLQTKVGERMEVFGLWPEIPATTAGKYEEIFTNIRWLRSTSTHDICRNSRSELLHDLRGKISGGLGTHTFGVLKKVCIVENLFVQVDYHVAWTMWIRVRYGAVIQFCAFNCSAAICSYVCFVHMNLNLNGCMYNLPLVLILC